MHTTAQYRPRLCAAKGPPPCNKKGTKDNFADKDPTENRPRGYSEGSLESPERDYRYAWRAHKQPRRGRSRCQGRRFWQSNPPQENVEGREFAPDRCEPRRIRGVPCRSSSRARP